MVFTPDQITHLGRCLARLKSKSLVFTVTAGRTGTEFLARLFESLPNVRAAHEAEPNFLLAARRAQEDPSLAKLFLITQKIPAMTAAAEDILVETSHLACKGFLEPMVALGLRPRLIMLRRDPRSIALSYLARQTVPGRSTLGWSYLLYPTDPGVLPLLPHPSLYTDYQLCFWYALEVERRQWHYRHLFADLGMRMADVTAQELHAPKRWLRLLDELGLLDRIDADTALKRHPLIAQKQWNRNQNSPNASIDFAAEEKVVWDAVEATFPLLQPRVEGRYAQ